jgi:hypothetical protein
MASPNEASIWSSSAPMDARNTPRSRYSSMQRPGLDRRLPRSLPLVSPLRAAPRAGCPRAFPGSGVASLAPISCLQVRLRCGGVENGHQMPTEILLVAKALDVARVLSRIQATPFLLAQNYQAASAMDHPSCLVATRRIHPRSRLYRLSEPSPR